MQRSQQYSGKKWPLLLAGLLLFGSCQTSHKVTASKKTIKNDLCAEAWLAYPDQPHPMWHEVGVKSGFPDDFAVPKQYKTYLVAQDTLINFFNIIRERGETIGMVIPVISDCESFTLKRSNVMSAEMQTRYPNIISLQGNGTRNKAADLRLDWDGKELKGQLMYNGIIYFITPVATSEGLIYMIYNKNETSEVKQPFESTPSHSPALQESQKILYDR